MRQSQLQLTPFDRDRLRDVGLRLQQLYPTGDLNVMAQKLTPQRIETMVDGVTKGLRGDVRVVPRQFLLRRCSVNVFDTVAEKPDAALPQPMPSFQEQRAAERKRPLEHEHDADDDLGYAVTSVEF